MNNDENLLSKYKKAEDETLKYKEERKGKEGEKKVYKEKTKEKTTDSETTMTVMKEMKGKKKDWAMKSVTDGIRKKKDNSTI